MIAKTVAAALGFSRRGRGNPFRAMADAEHELMIAFEVYQTQTANCVGNDGRSTHDWRSIFADAARTHAARCAQCRRTPSWQTVERFWRKHARAVIPPHLIDQSLSQKIDDILR
ncbi:MAG: hypothetical protein H0X67_01000 [Acidobacteria bacterium]|nr:hypothetical protein [Acidobacteriota bacterium]